MSKPNSSKVPRMNRLEIGINVIIQTLLVLFIVAILNITAFHYFTRWDVSRDKSRQLSEKTLQVLKTLPPGVKILALASPRDPLGPEIDTLLKDLRTASGKKIDVEFVNQFANLERASELQKQYKFGQDASLVIVDYKGKFKFVYPEDVTEWDRSGEMYGQKPRPIAFKGEQLLTSALIEVSEPNRRKLYILAGHGEADILGSEKFAQLKLVIERESILLDKLNLMDVPEVPEDASGILIAGARFDFTEREIEILQSYWNKKGRIMVLLSPDSETPRLDEFVSRAGLKPDRNRVIALKKSQEVANLVIVENRVVGSFVGDSPITKDLAAVAALMPSPVQSITMEEEKAKAQNIKLVPLFMTATGYWGEVDYTADQKTFQFDEGRDLQGPLVLAAQAEKGAVGDQRVQLDSSRMVVVGNSLFIDARALSEASLIFIVSGINWLTNREELIGVPVKEYKLLTLNIPDDQIAKISYVVLVFMPMAAAFTGFAVWWRRRN